MSSLNEFNVGDQVFIFHAGEWMGVEISGNDLESGCVYIKIVWTNGVPGYEVGDAINLDDGVEAYKNLTVKQAASV